MSLKPEPIGPIPEETARIARAAFPKGNLYLRLRAITTYLELFTLTTQIALVRLDGFASKSGLHSCYLPSGRLHPVSQVEQALLNRVFDL
jgi:hypothetical protein